MLNIYETPLAVKRITWDTVRYLLYHIRHIKVLTYITMDVFRRFKITVVIYPVRIAHFHESVHTKLSAMTKGDIIIGSLKTTTKQDIFITQLNIWRFESILYISFEIV